MVRTNPYRQKHPPYLLGILALALLLAGCSEADPAPAAGPPPLGGDDDDSTASGDDDDDSAAAGDDDDSAPAGDDDDSADDPLPEDYGPAFYPAGQVHSPISEYVADRLWDLGQLNPELQEDVFLKAGASSTVSSNTLQCFDGGTVDLGNSSHLEDSLEHFLDGDADGTSPFARETIAALVGHSAGWVIGGDPSPLQQELDALNPRYAFVHYGTNDMGLGASYHSALHPFFENMMDLVRILLDDGVVPMLWGISPRADSAAADLWVPTYNTAIRGMAQAHQIPFVDLHWATRNLDGYGLSSDGLHLNRHPDGACLLHEDGLDYGYNVRNLIGLEGLDRMHQVVGLAVEELDADTPSVGGSGSQKEPFVIHELPFADYRNTSNSPHRNFDQYTACGSDADESGPEYIYQLELEEETSLRIVVLDEGEVDIDLHLLEGNLATNSCIERSHQMMETTLPAGSYWLSLDTWVNASGEELSGDYLLLVLACTDGDTDCTG